MGKLQVSVDIAKGGGPGSRRPARVADARRDQADKPGGHSRYGHAYASQRRSGDLEQLKVLLTDAAELSVPVC
jgi:hypothetical protein